MILEVQSSAPRKPSLQQLLAVWGQASMDDQSLGTMNCHPRATTPALLLYKWDQSTQVTWYSLPLVVCQAFKTYQAEDLGLSTINTWFVQPSTIPTIRMPLLLLVGLLASGDFVVAEPLYHMLLEVT